MDEIGDQGPVSALLDRRSDRELQDLMANLGGHCIETLSNAFAAIRHDRPVVFIAYTIKGWGTPLAGHKDNHSGLMTKTQMAEFQAAMGIQAGQEWDKAAGLDIGEEELSRAIAATSFFAAGTRRFDDAKIETPVAVFVEDKEISTQTAFGKILESYAKQGGPLADRIVTTSPDVTVSTNLGPWVNRRGLFDNSEIEDTFRDEKVPSAQKWRFGPGGQHIELGIAEMNLFLLLAAAGLSHSLFGTRLLPVGTLYDPFISRGLDALNYACYQDARFLLVATPSGVTLAPEGGAHQSIAAPLIGLSQDGLASYEPAFADELGIVMDWAFDHMQREGEDGGSVYLRLTTRTLEQPVRQPSAEFAKAVIEGAYWWREPGPNADTVIVYQGCVAPEAIEAAGRIGEDRRDIGVLAVTSAASLHADWLARRRERRMSIVERLLARVPRHATLITVIDGHPATLAWLGGVCGHRVQALGVSHFGQTGTIQDLYRHYGIGADGIAAAAEQAAPGRPIRHLRAIG
jgi:pyruvate dehydrogenase E1 component